MVTTENPLISVIMLAYNHEAFIADAIQGAVSQTYSPLEIIVSDDASTDNTYNIIERQVAAYQGPHRFILNRNICNLGLTGNLNVAMGLASGEWIVGAAGDDVSLPNRVERTHAFVCAHPGVLYCCARARWIDERGGALREPPAEREVICKDLAECIVHMAPGNFGAAPAFHRKIFDIFGPLPNLRLRFEDRALPLRSLLLGQPYRQMDEVLILYRQHGGAICGLPSDFQLTNAIHRDRYVNYLTDYLEVLYCYHYDLRTALGKGLIDRTQFLDAEFAITLQGYCLGVTARAMAYASPVRRAWGVCALQVRAWIRTAKRVVSRRREIFLP